MAQLQLIKIPFDPQDVVYTQGWVASDMVSFFKPSGTILEPSKGTGVFMNYLPPDTEWCEISEGKDFFAYGKQVDWIIGNPPFKQFYEFIKHSFDIAKDIVYLLPADKPFNIFKNIKLIHEKGGIVHARFYGNGPDVGMPEIHRPVTAFHFRSGYCGEMGFSFATQPYNKRMVSDKNRPPRLVATL